MLKKIKDNLSDIADGVKNYSMEQAAKVVIDFAKNSTPKQMEKMLYVLESISPKGDTKDALSEIKEDYKKKGVWYEILNHFAKDIHPNCKEKALRNFVINQYIKSKPIRAKYKKKYGEFPPSHIVISPTMRCNLRCIGCYAGAYSKKDDLPRKYFEKAIKEARDMGIHFITISGGEPYIRKDLLDIFEKYDDIFFQTYTNGTFLDKKMCKRLQKLGNVAPAISVEGFEKETDARRGKGTWKKIMKAMDNLKEAGVPFGISITPTTKNIDIITKDKFIDFFIKKGATYGWYFHYIPIGKDPDLSLMPTAKDRDKLRRTVTKKWRKIKPIFLGDFWNDGPGVGGCMAGGSLYLHINVHGDIEPCVFVQMSSDNIKKTSLEKALHSKMFKHLRGHVQAVRAKKPTSENLLTPCCIIDNPEVLRECVQCTKPKFSYEGGEQVVKNPQTCAHLDKYSKEWHKIADKAWDKEFGHKFWKKKKEASKK